MQAQQRGPGQSERKGGAQTQRLRRPAGQRSDKPHAVQPARGDERRKPPAHVGPPSTDTRWGGIEAAVGRGALRASASPGATVDAAVEQIREFFGALPTDYASYLTRFGSLQESRGSGRVLLGLTGSADSDAMHTARILRALCGLEPRWIPIELLPDRQVACVDARSRRGAVSLIELDRLELEGVEIAPSLLDFVYDWLTDLNAIRKTVEHIRQRREAVEAKRRAADQLDRPGEWTVTRMCTQDVVFAVIRGRHNREYNRYDISAFTTATLSSFSPDAPVRAALTAVLSDAYRSGGPLAVAFGNSGTGPIPGPLRRWAAGAGVPLPTKGGWDAATGEALYVRAAALTDGTRSLLPLPGVSTAAVCYAVASGQWPAEAVEALLRWSETPQRILTGAVAVTDRLGWAIDRQSIRAAMLLAAAVRVLRRAGTDSDDDDSGTKVAVHFAEEALPGCDRSVSAVEISTDPAPARLPWRTLESSPGEHERLRLHILAVENHLLADQLRALAAKLTDAPPAAGGVSVVVPADANTTKDSRLREALQEAGAAGMHVIAAPDYTTTLDANAERALARARAARA